MGNNKNRRLVKEEKLAKKEGIGNTSVQQHLVKNFVSEHLVGITSTSTEIEEVQAHIHNFKYYKKNWNLLKNIGT